MSNDVHDKKMCIKVSEANSDRMTVALGRRVSQMRLEPVKLRHGGMIRLFSPIYFMGN